MIQYDDTGAMSPSIMKLLFTSTLLTICLTGIGQTLPIKTLTFYPSTYIDTEVLYTDSTGLIAIVQNSLPKGGAYTHPTGKKFGYRIFWTRVINQSTTPLQITLSFPGHSPTKDFMVFLPSDTMTIEKEGQFDYGATGLKSFLDADLHKPTSLQRTIAPNEACLFYIGVLFTKAYGAARAGLVLKEQSLFYKIRGIAPELDSSLMFCGRMTLQH